MTTTIPTWTPNAIILVAASLISTLASSAFAQKIYKCGNTYSHAACPQGTVVDTPPAPTPAQKQQADATTQRDASTAARMEQERLRAEAQASAAHKMPARAAAPASAASQPRHHAASKKKKKTAPEYFTANAPAQGKSKKMPARPAKKTSTGKTASPP